MGGPPSARAAAPAQLCRPTSAAAVDPLLFPPEWLISSLRGRGRYAGELLLWTLPVGVVLGLSFELPLSVALQDGCAQAETYIVREMRAATDAHTLAIVEPMDDYLHNCADGDAMMATYDPINRSTRAAMNEIDAQLAGLLLRPGFQASIDRLRRETLNISASLTGVGEASDCGAIHELYQELKTALCCDMSYGVTFLWIGMLGTAALTAPAAVAAIMGYKRFRRVLWGPYATLQALEVGAYL